MKNTKILFIAALLGTTLVACQKEKELQNPKEEQPVVDKTGWTLTVNATMDPATKAMSLDGKVLKAYWVGGETVGVYLGGTKLGTLTAAAPAETKGQTTELSGTLDTVAGLSVDSEIMLLFPDKAEWSYLGQDGSEPSESGSLATDYDYATSTLTVKELAGKKVTVNEDAADFTNEQSVYRFRFKVGDDAVAVKSIAISANDNTLVRSRSYVGSEWKSNCGVLTMDPTATPADNLYFMAIRNENTSANDTYTFTVVRKSDNPALDNAVFEETKDIPADALASPMYIPVSVTLVHHKTIPQTTSAEKVTTAL